jgi:hypothetical protein
MAPRLHDMDACLQVWSPDPHDFAPGRLAQEDPCEAPRGYTDEGQSCRSRVAARGPRRKTKGYEFLSFNPIVEVFEIDARDCRDFGDHRARVEF